MYTSQNTVYSLSIKKYVILKLLQTVDFGTSSPVFHTFVMGFVLLLLLFFFVDDHIGTARLPKFSDKPKMPFTEAFIYEVFRHASYVPFTIPHW